jgi:hypothetical protein
VQVILFSRLVPFYSTFFLSGCFFMKSESLKVMTIMIVGNLTTLARIESIPPQFQYVPLCEYCMILPFDQIWLCYISDINLVVGLYIHCQPRKDSYDKRTNACMVINLNQKNLQSHRTIAHIPNCGNEQKKLT